MGSLDDGEVVGESDKAQINTIDEHRNSRGAVAVEGAERKERKIAKKLRRAEKGGQTANSLQDDVDERKTKRRKKRKEGDGDQ